MCYYLNYNPATDTTEILPYDEKKHGAARYAAHGYFLFHGAIHVSNIYKSVGDALKACGTYSRKPVILPDGSPVVPLEHFHPEEALKNVFIPWSAIRGEIWPSEAV